MRIKNVDERHFYEIEAAKNDWSLSELKRQLNSALYERLLLSTDKNHVMQLAKQGQLIETPTDAVKDPYILEFLGLEEKSEYSESDLENRILDNLQKFLLELGKGYTFVARQKRFTFDEEHYRVDLVFYNRLLQCFVLIDLKIGELKHQDLGQMQMYVNYYDRYEKQEFENPTIGILLCREKNDAMVELTLPKDSNIFASKYELYLPDKKLLQQKLQEWVTEEGGLASNEDTI
jgi:predicted nuclease of restriction endonuclease-like (RecB) superfamily